MLEKKTIIDLTKILDGTLEIYHDENYRDPELVIKPWCSVHEQGFRVSQVTLGTQTGTHIDAPAHFVEGGATLEQLPIEHLLGRYFWIDLDALRVEAILGDVLAAYRNEPILFLASQQKQAYMSEVCLRALCQVPAKLWALAGSVHVLDRDPLDFHRLIAEQGIYLVEDLDPEAAKQVQPGGDLIALPLRLTGVSGAPCRVVVVQD
ncbi:putative cyclase superfamily [Candidatus Vecturithrix granuli]|uniref:Putative cyclase superfamily n=1 Tax=Vecturithrix granuli TaxID=1499967 RepID=A0A081BY74_VECG1|nr:putative cyclase superfamily [Candidatus Vecturithrix granuli]